MIKQGIAVTIILLLVLIAGCGFAEQAGADTSKVIAAAKPEVIVYVSGLVQRPGVYHVLPGTMVGDVIKMAGGMSPEADVRQVDLLAPVIGTTQVYVPKIGEQGQPQTGGNSVGASANSPAPIAVSQNKPAAMVAAMPAAQVYRCQPEVSASSMEKQMLDLVNRERSRRGLTRLEVDAGLMKTARLKSQDMVDNGYFAHESPKYGPPSTMISSRGISYHYCGENIAEAGSVEEAFRGLMGSPGHRQNILQPLYTKIGIGIVSSPDYGLVITQHFVGD